MKPIILFCASLYTSLIISAHALPDPIFEPKPLLIFYDHVETTEHFLSCGAQSRAILLEFMSALLDKAAPILVAESLMHNFLNRKMLFDSSITFDLKTLEDWFAKHTIKPCIPDSIAEIKRNSTNLLSLYKSRLLNDSELMQYYFYTELLVPYSIDFDEKNWVVKKLSEFGFYLLIPRAGLATWAPTFTKNQDLGPEIRLLPEEQELGLRFQHFPSLATDFFKRWYIPPERERPQLLLNVLQKLFVSVTDYQKLAKKTKQLTLPLWHVYLVGHGKPSGSDIARIEFDLQKERADLERIKDRLTQLKAYLHVDALRAIETGLEYKQVVHATEEQKNIFDAGKLIAEKFSERQAPLHGKIAGMPIPYVTHLLRFFNDLVVTRFLVLSSCFAAGANLAAPYTWEGKPLALNYTVVSHALTEEVTTTFASKARLLNKIQTHDIYQVSPAFVPFFTTLMSSKPIDSKVKILHNPFADAMAYVSGNFAADGTIVLAKESALNNLSWIRVPGSTWFSFTSFREQAIMITPMLRARYAVEKEKKPVDVQNKSLLLLATSTIDFPLHISLLSYKLPQIISLIPGVATHHFSQLVTAPVILKDVVEAILREGAGVSATGLTKFFYFEHLTCAGTDFAVLIIKNKRKDQKLVHQVYQLLEDNSVLLEEWQVGASKFGASRNELKFISKKAWQSALGEFNLIEKSAREKLAITFREYDALKEAYAAALRGSEQTIKMARIIEQYRLMRSKDRDAAEKYLSLFEQAAQNIVRQVFADLPSKNGTQVLDLRMRLRAIELL